MSMIYCLAKLVFACKEAVSISCTLRDRKGSGDAYTASSSVTFEERQSIDGGF